MGMINYETILSAYDDKLTLMQWLKKVEKALNEAAATSFKVNKKGSATISFSIVFEDGSELESGDIILQQGESVAAARIENGHLILTLTNGDELDAGNLFNGNVNIVGNVEINGTLKADVIETDDYIKPQTANMQIDVSPNFMGDTRTIATADADITEGVTSGSGVITFDFAKARVSNGKLNIVFSGHLTTGNEALVIGGRTRLPKWAMTLPQSILSKIFPIDGGLYNVVLGGKTYVYNASSGGVPPYKSHFIDDAIFYTLSKYNNGVNFDTSLSNTTFPANSTYAFRIEVNIVL